MSPLVAAAIALALSSAAPHAEPPGRLELALSWQRLERALAQRPPEPALARALHVEFDRATRDFFLGDAAGALEALDALTARLAPAEERPAARLLQSVGLTPAPPVLLLGAAPTLSVRLRSNYEPLLDEPLELEARVAVVDAAGLELAGAALAIDDGGALDAAVALSLAPPPTAPARLWVELRAPDGAARGRAPLFVLARPAADSARRARDVLAALPEGRRASRAAAELAARAELLGELAAGPSERWLTVDLARFAAELERDAAALAAGAPRDPRALRGERWSSLEVDGAPLPYRAYVPEDTGPDEVLPLVIAFHGAGVNEDAFLHAYGGGLLRELARARRFVAATPSTYAALRDLSAFDALLATLLAETPSDPAQVYVLGHSLGAGVAARVAAARPAAVRRAACLAGGAPPAAEGAAPVQFVLAELDGVVPAAPLRAAVLRAREAGRDVELVWLEDQGHTLMVPAALPLVLDRFGLLARAR